LVLAVLEVISTEVVLAVPILFLRLSPLLPLLLVAGQPAGLTQLRVLLLILAVPAVVAGISVLRQIMPILELVAHQGKVTLAVMAAVPVARTTKAVVVVELLLLAAMAILVRG
jgi:hypothetical protein